jgi:hypothetical protein
MRTEGRNTLICGRTGSGKSFLMKKLLAGVERSIVYGPKREECDYPGCYFDGMEPDGFKRFVLWWQHCVKTCGRFRIVYRPNDLFDISEFDKVANLAYACGNLTFTCEELMTYTTERNIGQGFKRLLVAGRTRGINCFMLTQRPFKIPREVTSQAREAYIFATHEPTDLDYVRQTFGTELAAKLETLGQYEHVHWLDTGQVEVGKA